MFQNRQIIYPDHHFPTTMEQDEIAMWRTVDVKDYCAYRLTFGMCLDRIRRSVQKDGKDIRILWSLIKDGYRSIAARFKDMDITSLDDKFPVDILTELKDTVIPEMGRRYDELDSLLINYLSGSSQSNTPIIENIEASQGLVKRMGVLGEEFQQNKRYQQYRITKPNRF